MMKRPLFLLSLASLILMQSAVSWAQSVKREDRILAALARIKMSAQDEKGIPQGADATGFVIDRYGHILTVSHVLDDLGQFYPPSLKISVKLGTETVELSASSIVFRDQSADVLVLSFPTPLADRKFLCMLPSSQQDTLVLLDTKIYSAGFPGAQGAPAIPFLTQDGVINAFNAEGSTWVTKITFHPGLSGSPVYTASGQIIGIAKGKETSLGEGLYLFIPIQFIRSQIANFSSDCAVQNVNASLNKILTATLSSQLEQAKSELPTPNECVMLGKLSAPQTKKLADAPFGFDLISRLAKSLDLPKQFEVTATVDVNVRSTCPVVRDGKAYYGSVTRILKAGQKLVVSSFEPINLLGDTFYWGQVGTPLQKQGRLDH